MTAFVWVVKERGGGGRYLGHGRTEHAGAGPLPAEATAGLAFLPERGRALRCATSACARKIARWVGGRPVRWRLRAGGPGEADALRAQAVVGSAERRGRERRAALEGRLRELLAGEAAGAEVTTYDLCALLDLPTEGEAYRAAAVSLAAMLRRAGWVLGPRRRRAEGPSRRVYRRAGVGAEKGGGET